MCSEDMTNIAEGLKSSFRSDWQSGQLQLHSRRKDVGDCGTIQSPNEDEPNSEFRTPLTFIDASGPGAARNRSISRTVRSHAIGTALARKRFEEQKRGSHFRHKKISSHGHQPNVELRRNVIMPLAPCLPRPFGGASIDPFETLSVDARRLTTLFHLRSSLRAGEPVFNINDAIHFQGLYTIFETGLSDGALAAAISLALSYAASNWQNTNECVNFSSIAMHELRQKLADPLNLSPSATIGTILLLLGNAYRIGELRSAQSHLSGLGSVLRLCQQREIMLPPTLKRAIYWQDLFSSVFLGTDRVVSYEEFYPERDLIVQHTPHSTPLPIGFAKSANSLNADILAAAGEVAGLYADRPHWIAKKHLAEGLTGLDNLQARLEGHLQALRLATTDSLLLCCIIALHLCVYGYWDGVWNAALIPRELSTRLLHHLRCCHQQDFGNDDLVLWLVYVGKAFAIDAPVRQGLDDLWLERRCNAHVRTFPAWGEASRVLHTFVWSEVLFSDSEAKWFWERIGE